MSLSFILESNGPSEQNEVNVIGTIIYLTIVVFLFMHLYEGLKGKKLLTIANLFKKLIKLMMSLVLKIILKH